MKNAEKYGIKTEQLIHKLPYNDNSKLVFLFNISEFYIKKQDYKSARNTVIAILEILERVAPDSEEHRDALILASEVYRGLGDVVTAKSYANLAAIMTQQLLLEDYN